VIRLPLANGVAQIDRSIGLESNSCLSVSGTLISGTRRSISDSSRFHQGVTIEIQVADLVRIADVYRASRRRRRCGVHGCSGQSLPRFDAGAFAVGQSIAPAAGAARARPRSARRMLVHCGFARGLGASKRCRGLGKALGVS
jgi:hypothetical protein